MKFALYGVGAAALILAGCATKNEGSADIRRFVTVSSDDRHWLIQAHQAADTVIQPNESVLITVDRMFVSEFDELNFTASELLVANNPFTAHGEVAVLVAAQTDGPAISDTSFDKHVVVHYSGDTVEGQFSNFRNQRLFGPTVVPGNFLSLEIVVLEIDRPTDQDKALFQQLASLGKQLGGATAGPAFNVLAELGSSLLSAPSDDVQTRFRFNFDLGDRPTARLPLTPGLYALIREDERGFNPGVRPRTIRGETDWSKLCLDFETGELYHATEEHARPADGDGLCHGAKYLDNTYIVLHVEAGVPAQNVASQTFAGLTQELSQVKNPTTTALSEAVADFASEYARSSRETALSDAVSGLRGRTSAYGRARGLAACDASLQPGLVTADNHLTQYVATLHSAIMIEVDAYADADTENDLSGSVYSEQMRTLIRYFGSLDWGDQADPTMTPVALASRAVKPEEFTAVFGDITQFHTRVRDRANEVWPAPTCPPASA